MKMQENRSYIRHHPFVIYVYMSKFMFLLIIPLMQLLLFKTETFFLMLPSLMLNIFAVLLIVIYAIIRYKREGYRYVNGRLIIKKGLFASKTITVNTERINAVTFKKKILSSMLFGVAGFFADAPSLYKSLSTQLYIRKSEIFAYLIKTTNELKQVLIYKGKTPRLILMSAIWSNSVSGFLILAPLFNNLSTVLGDEFKDSMYNAVDKSSHILFSGIPPTLGVIANIFIICWGFSFLYELNRQLFFKVSVMGDFFVIRKGILEKTVFAVKKNSINALSINQSIFMIPLKLFSVYIESISTGKFKNDKSLLLAAENRQYVNSILKKHLPEFNLSFDKTIKPQKARISAYMLLPFSLLCVSTLLIVILGEVFYLEGAIKLILTFTGSVFMFWILFRIFAFKRVEIACNAGMLKLVDYKRFTVRENYIPIQKVQKLIIKQNPFQRLIKCCNVTVYTFSEKGVHYTVKHISVCDCKQIFGDFYANNAEF